MPNDFFTQQHGQGMPSPMFGPGRKVRAVTRRQIGDREAFIAEHSATFATPDGQFQTDRLVDLPSLDCSCQPISLDDVAQCSNPECKAVVCTRRHSGTCMNCGFVFCSPCMKGIRVNGQAVIVCKPCSELLTTTWLFRKIKALWNWMWE